MKLIYRDKEIIMIVEDGVRCATPHTVFEGTKEEIQAEINRLGLIYNDLEEVL